MKWNESKIHFQNICKYFSCTLKKNLGDFIFKFTTHISRGIGWILFDRASPSEISNLIDVC